MGFEEVGRLVPGRRLVERNWATATPQLSYLSWIAGLLGGAPAGQNRFTQVNKRQSGEAGSERPNQIIRF